MKVLIFGASGMVGQGVLRECLLDAQISEVISVGRSGGLKPQPKLREIVHADFLDFSALQGQFTGCDACFFCLGVSSGGMSEARYTEVTYGYTLAAAEVFARANPGKTFIYVSGQGTDSSEHGRSMWARVKGRTENALLRLPLQACMFRPGAIQPMDGIVSKTPAYRWLYVLTAPLIPLLRPLLPQAITSTRQMGLAMIRVARNGAPKAILETADINGV